MAERFDGLRGEMREGFAGVRGEIAGVRGEIAGLRGEIADLRIEMRAGFGDLKATLLTGFRSLPTRESSEEMVRLLRESNRLQEQRFAELDLRMREQHLEAQEIRRALLAGMQHLIRGQDSMSLDIRALVARIDALIRGRHNGDPPV